MIIFQFCGEYIMGVIKVSLWGGVKLRGENCQGNVPLLQAKLFQWCKIDNEIFL